MRTTRSKTAAILRRACNTSACLAGVVMLSASAPLSRASTVGFVTSESVSDEQPMTNLARADEQLTGTAVRATATPGDYPVINFKDADVPTLMRFPGGLPFPAAEPRGDHNFAMNITGDVVIPQAGEWSFGVKSNGGFHLEVGGDTLVRNASSGGSTRIASFDFTEPGTYAVDLTYYERARRASLELFASEGRFHRFKARGADFQLVGDASDGGLSLTPDVASTISADSDPANDSTSSDPASSDPSGSDPASSNPAISPDTSVPEPDGLLLSLLAVPWLLGRRRRVRPDSIERAASHSQILELTSMIGETEVQFPAMQTRKSSGSSAILRQKPALWRSARRAAAAALMAGFGMIMLSPKANANVVFASFQNADLQFTNTGTATTTGLASAGTPLSVTFQFDEDVTADGITYTDGEPIKATVTLTSEVKGDSSTATLGSTQYADQPLQDGVLKFTDKFGNDLLTVSDFTGDITGAVGGSNANMSIDTTLSDVATYSSDFLKFNPAGDVVDSTGLTLSLSSTFTVAGDDFLSSFGSNADGSFSGNATAVPEPSSLGLVCVAACWLLLRRRRPALCPVRA